jgi:transposase
MAWRDDIDLARRLDRVAVGLRRSRYVGMAKTRLQHYATAAAINLERVADWFAEIGREKTRRSIFVRVMEPVAA